MDNIFMLRFDSLLLSSPMMGGEAVYATINNKGKFIPQSRISKVHCPFTSIMLLLYPLMMDVEFFYSSFCFQSFNLISWILTLTPELTSQQMIVLLALNVLITPNLFFRRLCWFTGCCFWLSSKHQK